MQDYYMYMTRNYLAINAIIIVIGFLLIVSMTRRLNAIAGFLVAIPLIFLICALVVGGFYTLFTNGRAVSAFISDPQGGSAFMLESGIEFGLPGALFVLMGYVLERARRRRIDAHKERMKVLGQD